jgi:hypothetical protein
MRAWLGGADTLAVLSTDLYLMATDSRRPWIVAPIMAVFLIGWGYTRLYVFPRDCLLATVVDAPRLDRHVSSLYLAPTTFLLTLLLGLQVYWYQMLAGKGLRVLFRDKPKRCGRSEGQRLERKGRDGL